MFNLPEYVNYALDTLTNAGYKAYIAGGSVRDTLLGRTPTDYDITTNALPDAVQNLFPKTVPTGIKHGTVTVILQNKSIEITTFRCDGEYTDHRSPDSVEFIGDIGGDLARRDFTVNAMAYSESSGLIDLFGGQKDIECRIIRAVGDPEKRFDEDALRILRAFRFAAKLGFDIEKATLNAAYKKAYLLKDMSRERIFAEISKTLTSDSPQILEKLINCGALRFLGFEKENISLSRLPALSRDLSVRFYAFCKLSGVSAAALCRELKTDNKILNTCKEIDFLFDCGFSPDKSGIKKMLYKVSKASVAYYLELINKLDNAPDYLPIFDKVLSSGEPYRLKELKVNGNDIVALGYTQTEVGKILEKLLLDVIENPDHNTKEYLLSAINN